MLFKTYVQRGKIVESFHTAKCLVKNTNFEEILSSNHSEEFIYPRSAIKIFQALPFVMSGAKKKFNLNEKILAISCASHCGESVHLNVLNDWLKKINLSISDLECGTHNPINLQSSNNLFLNSERPTQLHNNCAGKHLAMLSGCLANNMEYENYISFNHPYQKLIRDVLEHFTESKIQKQCIGTDGCSAPQYAFTLNNLSNAMINLIKEKKIIDDYSQYISMLLNAIGENPILIGGNNRFDSEVINHTNGRVFCKGGAEGVFLFADISKKIGGVIKIKDGNERAIPSLAIEIFIKLKLLSNNEINKLQHWSKQILYNHAKKNVGEIFSKIII